MPFAASLAARIGLRVRAYRYVIGAAPRIQAAPIFQRFLMSRRSRLGLGVGILLLGLQLERLPEVPRDRQEHRARSEEPFAVFDDRAVRRAVAVLLQLERIGNAERDVSLLAPHLVARGGHHDDRRE